MRRRFTDTTDHDDDYPYRPTGRCTCHVGWNWENGPCDYCTDPVCHECDHEECPDDCFCDCNDNTEEE